MAMKKEFLAPFRVHWPWPVETREVCSKCEKIIEADWLKCGYCGATLRIKCPSCGKAVSALLNFCTECGAKLKEKSEEY